MPAYPEMVLIRLSESLRVDRGFLTQCIEASVLEIQETDGAWGVSNGSVLRLRRLERLCHVFNVDVPVAKHILDLTDRLAELEEQVRRLHQGDQ
jgi:hypothetical protein